MHVQSRATMKTTSRLESQQEEPAFQQTSMVLDKDGNSNSSSSSSKVNNSSTRQTSTGSSATEASSVSIASSMEGPVHQQQHMSHGDQVNNKDKQQQQQQQQEETRPPRRPLHPSFSASSSSLSPLQPFSQGTAPSPLQGKQSSTGPFFAKVNCMDEIRRFGSCKRPFFGELTHQKKKTRTRT